MNWEDQLWQRRVFFKQAEGQTTYYTHMHVTNIFKWKGELKMAIWRGRMDIFLHKNRPLHGFSSKVFTCIWNHVGLKQMWGEYFLVLKWPARNAPPLKIMFLSFFKKRNNTMVSIWENVRGIIFWRKKMTKIGRKT